MQIAFRSALITLLLVINTTTVYSAEWMIDPTLSFKAGYNDNIRLSTDDKASSAQATLSPSAIFSVATPASGASGSVRFDFRRYEDDSNLDDNNVRFNVNSYHNLERSSLGLDIGFIKDTTLDSQLEATGLVFGRVRRHSINASPNWSYNFNQRTRLSANYRYNDVEYKNAGGTGFIDFHVQSAQTSLARVLNERTTATVTLSRSKSDNDNSVETINTNFQGGASYRFSETLSASLSVGARRTEVDFSQTSLIPIFSGDTIIGFVPLNEDVSNSDWGSTYNASVAKAFLRGETGLSISRDISTDVNGLPFEVTRLRTNGLYRFSETLSTTLNAEIYHSESNNSEGVSLDRDYYTIEPRLNWAFKKFWRLSGSYRYRKQTFDNTSDDATQNEAYLTLTYLWPRIAVSR